VVRKGGGGSKLSRLKSVFHDADIVPHPSLVCSDFKILLIAVQDDKIQSVVTELSAFRQIDWSSKVVFHTSGMKRVGILSPLKKLGAAVGALHPIAAFANEYQPEAAHGICYDFFGDKAALSFARQITKLLTSRLIVLGSERQRALLHIASAIASNSTVVAVRSAEKLISSFVSPSDAKALTAGLLSSTVRNLSTNIGMKSLTGPLARGDVEVVSEHIKSLESERALLQFYKSWSQLGVELLLKDEHNRSRYSPNKRRTLKEIRRLLEEK
jgi:predicted short-subunit dehydrogenase-like oxidoreductase (DUF2520 family)